MASNACAGTYRVYLPRNMVRFHASTGLARLPYFLAVPCLCLQLQPILSRFVLGNPMFPLTHRSLLPYINNMTDCLNVPHTVNVTVRGLIDEVGREI